MSLPTKENPNIKYVKAAQKWCLTYFEYDKKNVPIQRQEWSDEKPEIEISGDEDES